MVTIADLSRRTRLSPRALLGIAVSVSVPASIYLGTLLNRSETEPEVVILDMSKEPSLAAAKELRPPASHTATKPEIKPANPSKLSVTERDYRYTRMQLLRERKTLLDEKIETLREIEMLENKIAREKMSEDH
ncbi:hypothetical protein IWQ60_011778 [Tieghemiomyces parasiticus]|uniref:Uncharacterized protein n=1 Tax=Tieghemiomyces parasiticus TaxID=78921 RepID=A0A9W7ZGH7_9FUNG|nr:hypothetical protein IWQ60_011778 [Tieghemiomyces parasiticus]